MLRGMLVATLFANCIPALISRNQGHVFAMKNVMPQQDFSQAEIEDWFDTLLQHFGYSPG
jgi:hypothetical protein